LSKKFAKDDAQSFPRNVIIQVLRCPSLEALEGMMEDSGQLRGGWSLLESRGALTATFESKEAMRGRGTWQIIPERCRAAHGGGMTGRRHHRPHDPFIPRRRGWSR